MLDANVESDIKLKDFNTYKQHSMAELWERNNGMEKETSEIQQVIYMHRFADHVSAHFLHTLIDSTCKRH